MHMTVWRAHVRTHGVPPLRRTLSHMAAGGLDANYNRLDSAELFDPTGPAWSAAGNLATPIINFGMAA